MESDLSVWQQAAQGIGSGGGGEDFAGIIDLIINSILDPLIVLLVGVAALYFMVGVFKYVNRGNDEGGRAEGAQMMTYGIVALFVIISVWGLVNILINTFSLDTSKPPIPTL